MLRVESGGRTLATHVENASTPWTRMKGLLGRRSVPPGYAMVIEPCRSIHTWFMRCAIDAVFVDKDGRVVKVASDVRPFRLVSGGAGARAVVELASGGARRAAVRPGDRLIGLEGPGAR
jgi:uncharacterized protein